MAHEMDQFLTMTIISVVVVMVCMGCIEMSKMNSRYTTSGSTCGKKADIAPPSAISARESSVVTQEPNMTGAEPESFSTIDGDWTLSIANEAKCKHQEFEQNEEALSHDFNAWEADPEVTRRFADAAPDKEMAKKAAISRPLSLSTEYEEPTRGRRLGLTSFRDMYDGNTGGRHVVFSEKCPEWGGSDAHFAARSRENMSCRT